MLHAHCQRLAKEQAAHDEVALAPGQVNEVRAQLPCGQVKHQRQRARTGQRPQCHKGLVRNDFVKHHRGDQACDQHQQVRQHGRQQGRAVIGHKTAHRAPQPMARGVAQQRLVALRWGLDKRCGDQRNAGVFVDQLGFTGVEFMVLAPRHDHAVARGLAACVLACRHDAGVTVFEQQHRRQQQVVQLTDGPLHQPAIEACLAQDTQGLIWPQAAHHRGACQQGFGRALAPVVAREPAQRMRQRIVVQVPSGFFAHDVQVMSKVQRGGATTGHGVMRMLMLMLMLMPGPPRPSAQIQSRCRAPFGACQRVLSCGPVRPDSACKTPHAPGCAPDQWPVFRRPPCSR